MFRGLFPHVLAVSILKGMGMPASPPVPGYTVAEVRALTGRADRSIRRYVANGDLDVIRRGNRIFITPESVERLRDDLQGHRGPVAELSEEDRDLIRQQVRAMARMTPEQLTALGTLLAEIRLTHAARIAEERTATA